MAITTSNSDFWRGVKAGLPFLLVIGPFGMLFGVVGTEAGLNLAQVMGFSVLVIAGSAQFTAVQLMTENAPTLIVLATALAVNLRMAMYSAALVPHIGDAPLWKRALVSYFLVDQTYAASVLEFENRPTMTSAQKLSFFAGVVLPVCPIWYAVTLAGALIGEAIPDALALDFAIPITFIALVAPALRTLPHVIAAATSVVFALAFAGMPSGVGLMLAAILAMAAGSMSELYLERRA